MTTPDPLDGPPADGLDRAFRLPGFIQQDDELVALYKEIVARLRREASGMPMNTLQQLLIERQASFYVQIKYKENTETFSPNQQKEFNSYWLDLNKEFARQLAQSEDKLRQAMIEQIASMTQDVVALIPDDELRRLIRRKLSEGFAEIGV
jgi:hypothetical protein